ncbi:hypothetical protein IV01_16995, partial [Pseudomonas syringae]
MPYNAALAHPAIPPLTFAPRLRNAPETQCSGLPAPEGLVKGEGFAVDASIIKADASRQRGVPSDEEVNWSDPSLSTRAVREYLEALDEEALAEALPKRLSLTDDPLARWTAAPGGPALFAYSTNYLIDVEHGVIMDVEPTPAHRTAEVASTKTMIERVEEQFGIKPDRLIGDT